MSYRPEFFSWRKAILKSSLPPTTRHVLLTLACHMNDAGESCYPSIKLLCDETGLSNRTVITHLHEAKELGWITVGLHGFAGQKWAAHEYFPGWPHNLRNEADSLEKAVNEVHKLKKKAVKEVHKLKQQGGEPNAKGGELGAKGGELGYKKAVKEVHTSIPMSTSLSNSESTSHNETHSGFTPSQAASCCQQMRVQGIAQCNPSHPTLLALIDAGATKTEFSEAAKAAMDRGKNTFAYVLGIVRKQREDAAKLILHRGPLPTKQEALEQENKESTQRAKARLFGLQTEKDITNETTRL